MAGPNGSCRGRPPGVASIRGPPQRAGRLPPPGGPAEPLPAGRPSLGAPLPHPRDPLQPAGGGARRAASHQALPHRDRGQGLEPAPGRGLAGPRGARVPRDPAGPRAGRRAALRPPAPHGRLLRVLDDAGAGGRRPEAAGRALLRVPERRGGLHQGPLRAGRDAARPHVRAGEGRSPRALAAGARLRAGEPRDPGGVHRRGQPLLLPAQDGAPGPRLRRAARDLPDLRQHRALAREARLRPGGLRLRGPGAPAPGPGAGPRAVRRERPREAGLHVQLLRLLLRGHARGAALRLPAPGPHDELRGRRWTGRPATAAASA